MRVFLAAALLTVGFGLGVVVGIAWTMPQRQLAGGPPDCATRLAACTALVTACCLEEAR